MASGCFFWKHETQKAEKCNIDPAEVCTVYINYKKIYIYTYRYMPFVMGHGDPQTDDHQLGLA